MKSPKTPIAAVVSHGLIYTPAGGAGEYAPLAVNPYRGCGHGCKYCYVPGIKRMPRSEFDAGAVPRENFLVRLRGDAARLRAVGVSGQVMLSFSTDPYHPGDTSLTRQTIEVLIEFGFGFSVLTKGGTRGLKDLDLYRPACDCFACTLTSLDDGFSRKWEPRAALPGDRLAALRAFSESGIFTWVSLEPTLDVESGLAIIEATHTFVDLFKIGRANYIGMTAKTDWKSYTLRMAERCARLGVAHYFKRDLACYLLAGYPNNMRVEQHR
ncbi:MAG: radical SAM protein [Terracidiphilus sp.]|jgi:DNA repair photolyase